MKKLKHWNGSFFDEIIDPLDAGRFILLPPLWLFLPRLLAHHQQHEVGKSVFGGRCFWLGLGERRRRDESLLYEEEIGVVLLCLLVAAVAWMVKCVQTVRKE